MKIKKTRKILLVEDEILIAMSEKNALEASGYLVLMAHSGDDAIEKVSGDRDIDLILMDIDLGKGIDGTEAAAHILKIRDVPIVFLSSHMEQGIVEKTENITSYGYIVKNSAITVIDASIKMAFKLFYANRALIEKELLLHSMAENYPNSYIFIIERDYSISYVSGHEFKEEKLEKERFVGRKVEEFAGDHAELFDEYCERTFGGEEISFEIFMFEKYLFFRAVPLLSGDGATKQILVVMEDATERKLLDAKAQASARLLQTVIDNTQYLIYAKDLEGRFILASQPLARAFGVDSPEMILGKTTYDFEPEAIADQHRANDLAVVGYDELLQVEEIAETPDGIRNFLTTKFPLHDDKGKLYAVCGTSVDITNRKRAEEKLAQSLKEKEVLLREVHHRIKNNIASMEGLLMIQSQAAKAPEAQEALQDAIGRIKTMRVLYDKLLIGDDYREISIKEYLESLIDSVAELFPEKESVRFATSIDDFSLNSKKLFPIGIIVNEILTNVMKHAFPNRDEGSVSIDLRAINNKVTLTISDDGVGLPKDFELKASKGFGIMLINLFSEQLGGTYSIKSDKGTASVLKFDLLA